MSETNKISIARALVELKSLGGRIERAATQPVVSVILGEAEVAKPNDNAFKDVESLKVALKSNFDSLQGLIQRRELIKRALVKANAETTVTIGGKNYTLAEAIEMKKFVVSRKAFLNRLQLQLRSVSATVGTKTTELQNRIDAYSKEQADNGNEELVKNTIADMRKRGTPSIVAPVDLQAFITKEMSGIEEFEQEVDIALNETNAATKIEVPAA